MVNLMSNMDYNAVCRTCLSTKSVSYIFQDPNEYERYSTAIFITAGVKVEINDGLPQNMCTSCIDFVNSSIKFRNICRDVQAKLTKLKHEFNQTLDLHVNNDNLPSKVCINITTDNIKGINIEFNDINNVDVSKPVQLLKSNINDIEEPLLVNDTDVTDFDYNQESYTTLSLKTKGNEKVTTKATELPYNKIHDGTSKKQRVSCKLCFKNLSIRSIDVHMAKYHPGADKRKVKCDLCDSFVLTDKLERHKSMMHGTESFKCGYCKSEFDTKELLIDHVTTCNSKKRKRKLGESGRTIVECDVCHKQMQKASLRMHKAVKHAGLGPVCEHCGQRLANKFRLQEHRRAKHGYDKYKCSYCDFQSAAALAMRNHERRHRGEQPFVCERCGAKFHAAYLLTQHRQSHRTERLVKCDLCPATFKANNSLHTHKLACHSRRAHRCGVCARAYSCSHYAKKHARRAHRNANISNITEELNTDSTEKSGFI